MKLRKDYSNRYNYWGEPERAPHLSVSLKVYIVYIYIYISYVIPYYLCLYGTYSVNIVMLKFSNASN